LECNTFEVNPHCVEVDWVESVVSEPVNQASLAGSRGTDHDNFIDMLVFDELVLRLLSRFLLFLEYLLLFYNYLG